ncbi:MAG: chromosome segregation protein SMC, partial [Clostridia bacterium]
MYLKRLELKGFKSFPIKTDILFKEGITSIVGPNGSGKSNISDAVRWVLGEQSIKSLRGDKLEDVIFAGTDTKKPMNYCEVALTIDNSDNKLELDFTEVTIKRRAYRNGESEFFLNNKSCRLKDIKEILLDTGIGKDGYSIIEQGKVDEILSNNPVNRRKVFDEACGISKFRYKKQEAEKNLRNTKENLERINDIYIEIENQLKPLFSQQNKAKKYIEINEKLKMIEVNSYICEIEGLERELSQINKHSQLLDNESNEVEKQKLLIEKSSRDINKDIEDVDGSINKSQEYINTIKSVISQKDAQVNLINERIKNCKNDIERKYKELNDIKEKLSNNKLYLNESKNNRIKKEDKIKILETQLKEIEEKNSDKKSRIENIANNVENLKDDIINLLNKRQEANSKLSTLIANTENINTRTKNIDLDIEELKVKLKVKNEVLINIESICKEKSEELTNLKIQNNNINKELSDLTIINIDLDKKIQNNRYNLNDYNSKLNIYIEMENHNEGFNKGVKEVIKNKNLQGIHGALGQVVSVESKYEKAIESALGAYMQNIITDDENCAKVAINYLKKNNLGRVTFLPLNIIKSNKIDARNIKCSTKFIGVASDLVSYNEKYRNIFESILGRTIIIENIDDGIRFAKETGHKFKVVTLDGEILNPGGSLTGGSFRTNANILSRKRLINEYNERIRLVETDILTLNNKKEKCIINISRTKENIAKLETNIKELDRYILIENSNINQIEDEKKSLQISIKKLENEKNGLDSNLT